ncbi:hypothetical protein [Marinobacterium sediminicola]|uniref:Uncharacterized protein n=1 Tax=Marinobacterium sediminicola TaxID=518898 RepID=A0ABY1S300_9GAMM|nr:hypothetical protein [Marinobacterium sediminicola]ULG70674.1 hypothetical protein LN244_07670 [Marinobacterium sediminicola]SMR77204.1 hypothetical protein SAMN04487964_11336 [Marinobacterium sediminicola]
MINLDPHMRSINSPTSSSQRPASQDDFAAMLAEQAAKTAAEAKRVLEQDHTANALEQIEKRSEADLREELLRLAAMCPAERIRYQMLKEMGLTEETLQALPFDERMRIEQMIQDEIERQLGGSASAEPNVQKS